MKSISVIALERVIEELQQQRNIAVRDAAKPFDDRIKQIYIDIAKLTGIPITEHHCIPKLKGAKRGPKPKLLTSSLVYPIKGTVLNKILYVIKEAGRFITIGEIANAVKVYEPNVSEDVIKIRFGKHLDKYKKEKKLCSYFIGTKRNTVYGLPSWLKDEKSVEGREHDPDALIDRPRQEDSAILGPVMYPLLFGTLLNNAEDLLRTPKIDYKKE